jgi:hypothetical protein
VLLCSTVCTIQCWPRFGVGWEWIFLGKGLLVGTGIMACNGGLVLKSMECLDFQGRAAFD